LGKNFLSAVTKEVCNLYSIKKLNTTAYHPQTVGQVERLNSILCQTLSMFASRNQKNWDLFIPSFFLAFRTSPSESTTKSLFYLLHRREALLQMDVSLLLATDSTSSIAEQWKHIVQQIELAQRLANRK